jgi:hypothetical protein
MALLPFRKPAAPPSLAAFPLKAYTVKFTLDRLRPGVDNVRSDVRLSPRFLETIRCVVFQLVAKHAGAQEPELAFEPQPRWTALQEEFEWMYSDVILGAVFKARSAAEVQIDYLAQTAIVKALLDEIRNQFEELVQRFKGAIRRCEISDDPHFSQPLRLKEQLGKLIQRQEAIRRAAGRELFMLLAVIQRKELSEVREVHFGVESAMHHDVFTNPLLQADDPADPLFLMEEYGLLPGRYPDDVDTHPRLMALLHEILQEFDAPAATTTDPQAEEACGRPIDGWLKQVDNIDLIFNPFASDHRRRILAKQGGAPRKLEALAARQRLQQAALELAWQRFREAGLMRRIAALSAIRPLVKDYCPPLAPRVLLDFMITPRTRRITAERLRKLETLHAARYPLAPLRQRAVELCRLSKAALQQALIAFLSNLVRYQRDLDNLGMLQEAMGGVNLVAKESLVNLSRANNTLYEFLLPQEMEREEQPVLRHAVIKADLRGSTEITRLLEHKGLNPASYFSLNFFEPIALSLAEFGAEKVFIEGDAIILMIAERAATPESGYCVARACGLAAAILQIVRRHNAQTARNGLPPLGLGVGVAFHEGAPAYLLDAGARIMISPAINRADRMSGCTHGLQERLDRRRFPFNLHRFQVAAPPEAWWMPEEGALRFNVDGIELNPEGFRKLRQEIELTPIHLRLANLPDLKHRFYSGRYPTASGQLRPLLIREAQVPLVSLLPALKIEGPGKERYYEVVSQERLLRSVAEMARKRRGEGGKGADRTPAPHPGGDGAQA